MVVQKPWVSLTRFLRSPCLRRKRVLSEVSQDSNPSAKVWDVNILRPSEALCSTPAQISSFYSNVPQTSWGTHTHDSAHLSIFSTYNFWNRKTLQKRQAFFLCSIQHRKTSSVCSIWFASRAACSPAGRQGRAFSQRADSKPFLFLRVPSPVDKSLSFLLCTCHR